MNKRQRNGQRGENAYRRNTRRRRVSEIDWGHLLDQVKLRRACRHKPVSSWYRCYVYIDRRSPWWRYRLPRIQHWYGSEWSMRITASSFWYLPSTVLGLEWEGWWRWAKDCLSWGTRRQREYSGTGQFPCTCKGFQMKVMFYVREENCQTSWDDGYDGDKVDGYLGLHHPISTQSR